MNKNIGKIDKIIRIIAAVIISMVYMIGIVPEPFSFILLALGGILLITAIIDFCPLYSILNINSAKKSK